MNDIEFFSESLLVPHGPSPIIISAYGSGTRVCCSKTGDMELIDKSEEIIFDLASMTKLYLGVVYIMLHEKGVVSLNQRVDYYSNKFNSIGELTIKDLLSFNVHLETSKRLDRCDSYEEALNYIYSINGYYSSVQEYSDMPPIVLGLLLEDITNKSFGCLVDDNIIAPLGLEQTNWKYSVLKNRNCCSYEGEKWLSDSGLYEKSNPIGLVNDPKARILSRQGEDLCGHAGLFSSVHDIAVFSQALLQGKIVSHESLLLISEGSGRKLCSKNNSFGLMSFRKYSDKIQSEVPEFMSDAAFSTSGFTGCYLLIDPVENVFVIIGGNRLYGCISKNSSHITEESGHISFDGLSLKSSVQYVYNRDGLRDALAKKALELVNE